MFCPSGYTLQQSDPLIPAEDPPMQPEILETLSRYLKDLFNSRNEPFYGDSVDTLDEALIRYARKVLPIIQSSGIGKSRLVNEIARRRFTTTFTLRQNGSTGYPPGDPEITRFTKSSFSVEAWVRHGMTVALIGGIFQGGGYCLHDVCTLYIPANVSC